MPASTALFATYMPRSRTHVTILALVLARHAVPVREQLTKSPSTEQHPSHSNRPTSETNAH
eukprot:7443694-Pyramimonas_sp.AAC.1